MKIAAILCVRNGEDQVAAAIRQMLAQDIPVAVIDHASTDATPDILASFPLLARRTMPWRGYFSLKVQLLAKQSLIQELAPDWVVHFDADEYLHPQNPKQTLRNLIETAAPTGANVINFHDCTFLPTDDTDYASRDYISELRHYYFFQPYHPRMMRAFQAGLSNVQGAGHMVEGAVLHPEDAILRHYIALSRAGFLQKYQSRSYDPAELSVGWHVRREAIKQLSVKFPAADRLKYLSVDNNFDLSEPWTKNFWDYEN